MAIVNALTARNDKHSFAWAIKETGNDWNSWSTNLQIYKDIKELLTFWKAQAVVADDKVAEYQKILKSEKERLETAVRAAAVTRSHKVASGNWIKDIFCPQMEDGTEYMDVHVVGFTLADNDYNPWHIRSERYYAFHNITMDYLVDGVTGAYPSMCSSHELGHTISYYTIDYDNSYMRLKELGKEIIDQVEEYADCMVILNQDDLDLIERYKSAKRVMEES